MPTRGQQTDLSNISLPTAGIDGRPQDFLAWLDDDEPPTAPPSIQRLEFPAPRDNPDVSL